MAGPQVVRAQPLPTPAVEIAVGIEAADPRNGRMVRIWGAPQPQARLNRSLMDGEMVESRADGTTYKRRFDAVEQAQSVVPSARFARVFPGDSLAKLAAEHGVDARKLALLNRTVIERVYLVPDVICIEWTHTVRDGETLEKLAGIYNIEPRSLAQLNDLVPTQPLHLDQELTVPGEFQYDYHENGVSSLTLTQYLNESTPLPFDIASPRMRFEQINAGESFDDFLAKHDLADDFVRKMNGLGPEQSPTEGDQLLVEYSVQVTDNVTLDQLTQHFEVTLERLSDVNQLAMDAELRPGQRVEIPLGGRMRDAFGAYGRLSPTTAAESVFEVELKEFTP